MISKEKVPDEVQAKAEFLQAIDNIQAKYGVSIIANNCDGELPVDKIDWDFWTDREFVDQNKLVDFHGMTINRTALKYHQVLFDYHLKEELNKTNDNS